MNLNNESPLTEKQVIHTDFCDIHLTIDKNTKEPTDAYLIITPEHTRWMATHPDSVFLPSYFFDAYNRTKLIDDKGNRRITLCKSVPLNSKSYNGYDNTSEFPAWNFQIAGDYFIAPDRKTNDPHFLKIFHDGSGNCNVVQAGAFNSKPGRNLNVGYIKKVSTYEEQSSNKYQAGLFTDKAEKIDNFRATRGALGLNGETDTWNLDIATHNHHKIIDSNNSIKERAQGMCVIVDDKKMPWKYCMNESSKWNSAVCQSIVYKDGKFQISYVDLSTSDLENNDIYHAAEDQTIMNTELSKNNAEYNEYKNRTDLIETNDVDILMAIYEKRFEKTYIVDKYGVKYDKVSLIEKSEVISNMKFDDEYNAYKKYRYVVLKEDSTNPKYMEAIGTWNDVDWEFEVKDIDDNKPICVNRNNIIRGEQLNTLYFKDYVDSSGNYIDSRLGGLNCNAGGFEMVPKPNCVLHAFYYSDKRIDCNVKDTVLTKNATIDDIASTSDVHVRPIFDFNQKAVIKKEEIEEKINNFESKINLVKLKALANFL